MVVKAETWTRESHGLYDFMGTETQQFGALVCGSFNLTRSGFDVGVSPCTDFEQCSDENVIARCLFEGGSYWLHHKFLIEHESEKLLFTKPEDKCWQVVKSIWQPRLRLNCYKLKRNDLIKVGRVRFKIREIQSPVYNSLSRQETGLQSQFNRSYPVPEEIRPKEAIVQVTKAVEFSESGSEQEL